MTARDTEIFEQIFALFQQLSPSAQAELLEALDKDSDADLTEHDELAAKRRD